MKFLWLFVVLSIFLMSHAVFASGNLTVRATSTAPSYVNTNTSTTFLNLSLNVTPFSGDGTVNITVVNVTISLTFSGNVSGNISAVEVRNGTGASFGSNSTNVTGSKYFIALPNGFFISNTTNATMSIVINLTRTATRYSLIAVSITANNEIGTSNSADNITISTTSINSTNATVQDLHANASISPRFVDTNTINQTFIYTITPSGLDAIKNVNLSLPSSYPFVSLVAVLAGASQPDGVTNVTSSNSVNVTFSTPTVQTIKLNFTINTSSTPVSSSAFTANIDGGNLSGIATDVISNQTNVTTKVLANVTSITIVKTVAIVNGTDYWEFNFTINLTETLTGLLQFKMTNWNNTAGNVIPLVSGETNLTTLRKDVDFNTTSKINVRNDYNLTDGLPYSSTSGLVTFILRQVIPSGTAISQAWFTTYSMLFRPTAT